MTELLFAAYFLLLIATLIFKTPIIKGPWLFLLRAFFPNWKFFMRWAMYRICMRARQCS